MRCQGFLGNKASDGSPHLVQLTPGTPHERASASNTILSGDYAVALPESSAHLAIPNRRQPSNQLPLFRRPSALLTPPRESASYGANQVMSPDEPGIPVSLGSPFLLRDTTMRTRTPSPTPTISMDVDTSFSHLLPTPPSSSIRAIPLPPPGVRQEKTMEDLLSRLRGVVQTYGGRCPEMAEAIVKVVSEYEVVWYGKAKPVSAPCYPCLPLDSPHCHNQSLKEEVSSFIPLQWPLLIIEISHQTAEAVSQKAPLSLLHGRVA